MPFVEKELGAQKIDELKTIWQKGTQTIPEDATCEEKYNIAYGTWVQKYASAFNFVSDNLGENGVEKFKDTAVEALKRKSYSPALFLLKLMRAISPQTAFRAFAKQTSYQMQVFGPLSVSELSGNRLVVHSHCKVLDYADSEVLCTVGCQKAFPVALKEVFNVKVTFEPKGKSCTATFAPL